MWAEERLAESEVPRRQRRGRTVLRSAYRQAISMRCFTIFMPHPSHGTDTTFSDRKWPPGKRLTPNKARTDPRRARGS